MENLKASSSEEDIDEHENQTTLNGDEEVDDSTLERNNEHILLTSRRTKKHVTIQDDSGASDKAISNVEDAVQNLEKNFLNGINEIRNELQSLKSEKKSFEIHIKSLEESLKNSANEREKYISIINEQKIEIESLTSELNIWKKKNKNLQLENSSLQSDHEDHMKSIADQHRRKLVTKRTLRKWKDKLKNKELSKSQIYKITEENEKLKRELILYQESTKDAFLRSASVLNSEALSLFQNTASRLINLPFKNDDSLEGNENSKMNSSVSDESSQSSFNESNFNIRKEKKKKSHYVKEQVQENLPNDIFFRKMPDAHRRDFYNKPEKSHSDNEIQDRRRYYTQIGDFVPDPLRRETREIMKNLESNKKPIERVNSEKNMKLDSKNECHSKTHVHICHCTPFPGRSVNCPYCYPHQNISFLNMPKLSKSQPKLNVRVDGKKQYNSAKCISGERGRFIYKPSGSTVVVEKHLT